MLRRPKFKTNPSEIRRINVALLSSAEVISVKSKLEVVKEDPKDDLVIETAYDRRGNSIVTGNNHLLELDIFRVIKITTVEKALELF